jgi:hypothetical protein
MRCDIYGYGYQVHNVHWKSEDSVNASRSLARAMGFTDREMYGLRSFDGCIWERSRRYEVTVKLLDLEMEAETHCITSVGLEPETPPLARHRRLAATCDRWWYSTNSEVKNTTTNVKEWSGMSTHQEYTASPNDLRFCGP